MNSSPLERRHSHIRRVTSGGRSSASINKHKRVSFHQDRNFQRSPEEGPLKAGTNYQHYQSSWVLSDESSSSRILPPQIRRYQSDCFLNQFTDGLTKHLPLAERGVPEGQEDPEHLCSFQNLSSGNTSTNSSTAEPCPREELLLRQPRRLSRLSSTSRSALNLLSSVRTSPTNSNVQPKLFSTVEEKRALLEWARERWSTKFVPLPQIPFQTIDSITPTISSLEGVAPPASPEAKSCSSNTTKSVGLDLEDRHKIFKCFTDFYSGRPRPVELWVGEKAVHVIPPCATSLKSPLWSCPLLDIADVTVKWNYSILELCYVAPRNSTLNDSVVAICVEFPDPDDLRMAASSLDILVRRVQKRLDAVIVELPSQCKSFWTASMMPRAAQKDMGINYVGLLYFEESFIALQASESNSLDVEKSGHLMYSWSNTRGGWQAGYFKIKSGALHQFNSASDKAPICSLSLSEEVCKGYGRNFQSSRPHTLEIQFYDSKRLLLAAASETEASDWLSSLSQSALFWSNTNPIRQNEPPVPCGVVVTDLEMVLFHMSESLQILARAPLELISVVMTCQDDTCCLIECDYQEAHEGAGDWILYFLSSSSFEEFLLASKLPCQPLSIEISSILRKKSRHLRDF